MKIFEIEQNSADDISILKDACESWIEMWNVKPSIDIILSHPLAGQFKRAPSNALYRSVFTNEEKFKQRGKVVLRAQHGGFIPMSCNKKWGASARSDFDYNGDILQFEKKLNPADVVLNFSALVDELDRLGHHIYSKKEQEIWMKATPYYKTYTIDELIDVDRK
jgi:hypothetical protein